MTTSKKSYDGYLMVDHRSSPGIPEDLANKLGLDPLHSRGGALAEYATTGCPHCGAHVIFNPQRTRDRAWCSKCDRYICDWCDAARKEAGYEHRTFNEVADLVRDKGYTVTGPAGRFVLRPKGG